MTGDDAWELPDKTGRTIEYLILRVCERFRMPETWFHTLTHAEQIRLLGYEDVRQAEEAQSLGCPMFGKAE